MYTHFKYITTTTTTVPLPVQRILVFLADRDLCGGQGFHMLCNGNIYFHLFRSWHTWEIWSWLSWSLHLHLVGAPPLADPLPLDCLPHDILSSQSCSHFDTRDLRSDTSCTNVSLRFTSTLILNCSKDFMIGGTSLLHFLSIRTTTAVHCFHFIHIRHLLI